MSSIDLKSAIGPMGKRVLGLRTGDQKGGAWYHFPIFLVLLLGISSSIFLFFFLGDNYEKELLAQQYTDRAAPHVVVVRKAIDRYLEVVYSISGLYAASDKVQRDQFGAFVERSLARYTGIQALEWIPRIEAAERATYEQQARRDGHANFRIRERGPSGDMVPAAPREAYYPVYFVEPLQGNARALGFDLASNPARLAALENARDSGRAVATQRITLVQETGKQFGFLVFVPLYNDDTVPTTIEKRRAALTGFALGVFRIGDILETTMQDQTAPSEFDIYLFDESAQPGQRLLYYSPSSLREGPVEPLPEEDVFTGNEYTASFDVAGRRWTMVLKPVQGTLSGHLSVMSWVIAAFGILLTVLLVLYLGSARKRTWDVERQVADRSRELSASNLALETEMAERQRMEQQLVQTQKMEAMGQLTGGIAHDFNNLLMVIDGYARRAALKIGDDETVETCVQEVLKATERATKLTMQLLSFSRRQVMEKRVFRVEQAVTDVKGLLLRSVGEDYKIRFEIQDQKACLESDSGEFGQAILNLVNNARDAMSNGGVIVVGTRIVELDEKHTQRYRDMNPGRYVEIYVTDYGEGIYDDVLPRIFEPFFTTKEQGKGTGLGLAMVYGFAQQSGGSIEVESTVGEGTTFQIYLPIVEYDPATTTSEVDEMHFGNGETILLVEDDESLLTLTQFTLEDLGYKALKAGNGIEALEVEEDHEGTIDVLLSDVIMPSMGGFEAAEIIRERRPDIKIVFMSGYPNRGQKMGKSIPERSEFLQKPIQPDHSAKVIRNEIHNDDLRLLA